MLPSVVWLLEKKHDEQRFDVSNEKERSVDHFLGKNIISIHKCLACS